MNELTKPAEALNYYRGQIYWNDFEQTRQMMNLKISGNPEADWASHCKDRFGTFGSCFIPNCGNGWVERDLFKAGLIKEASGFDISEDLVRQSQNEAGKIGLPAKYITGDCNKIAPPEDAFDLVVNYAAMHHVAYINRLTNKLARSLKPNGRYIAFDYVGPHRNQYPWKIWEAVIQINASLPPEFQIKQLAYPHLKTMLHTDPTEAIHSELQVELLHRYFHVDNYVPLGGPIAYHLLFGNRALFEARQTMLGAAMVHKILEADDWFVSQNPDTNLFAFWIATPKPPIDDEQASVWQFEEHRREAKAAQNGGRYYPATALEILMDEVSDLRYEVSVRTPSHVFT